MLTKVRIEIAELFSWKKSLLFIIGTLLCTHAELEEYIKWYEGANLCEFIMFFLTNQYIILMLVTMAVIILSSDRYGFQNRYVILTRYKSRSEFYLVNLYAKAVYAAGCIIVIVVLVTGYGWYGGLSEQAATFFMQISYEIVAKQCLNILGYAMFVVTLYSLFNILVRNKVLDVFLMMGVPLFNLMAMKSGMPRTEKFLPWYKIAYELYGWEMNGYRFNAMCIHWIAMRITAWLSALWQMLWLEQRFMIYLFIRERNYRKMFVRQYERCALGVVSYFVAQLLVFAALAVRSYGVSFVCSGFLRMELWAVLINEILGTLNFCLLVYGLYCKTRKAEISFLILLAARMVLGCAVGGLSQYLYLCLAVNLLGNMILTVCVMNVAGAGFYDRVQGEA